MNFSALTIVIVFLVTIIVIIQLWTVPGKVTRTSTIVANHLTHVTAVG